MKKYMLVLFSYAGLNRITEELKEKLKEGDQLFVRAVMLEEVPKLFEHLISDVGFLGEKVVSDVEDSVVDIYQDNARDYLRELKQLADAKKINVDQKLVEHHDLANLKREIKKSELDGIIINFSENEFVSDQVREEEIKDWLEEIKLPKGIFYDGRLEHK